MTDAAIERELAQRQAKLTAAEFGGMGPVNRRRHAERIDALEYEQEQRRKNAAAPPEPPEPPTPEVPEIHLRPESHTPPAPPAPTPAPDRKHDPTDPALRAAITSLLRHWTNGTIAAALWDAERVEMTAWREARA
jgi:hypothetical protein